MNRIENLFAKKQKNILSVFFTAGYPNLHDTMPVLTALQSAGIDLVEIGIPFSDPLADGPVIQESSMLALENGMNIRFLFEQLREMRKTIQLPVVLMGYLNPVMQFGVEKFLQECRSVGIDGLILPDLPMDVYEKSYQKAFDENEVAPVFLVTTRSPLERIQKAESLGKGFLYLVSSSSTTGSGNLFSAEQEAAIKKTKEAIQQIPVLTGFGIHNKKTLETAFRYTQGAIVGTAFIRSLDQKENAEAAVADLLNKLKISNHDYSIA
jgi:tryptophan synthase alpha chain